MELLKLVWTYAIAIWPYATMLGGTFAGIYFGIKMGYKWGKQDAERSLKTKIWNAINIKLGYPLATFMSTEKKEKLIIQGTLEVDCPHFNDVQLGLPVSFKFVPDRTQ